MRFRLATVSDASTLSTIYCSCNAEYQGFMHQLGIRFMRTYYQVVLREENHVILCVESEDGDVVGFVSGFLKAQDHLVDLRENRLLLLIAALPKLILKPALISELVKRYRTGAEYVVDKGPRCEFWGVMQKARGGGVAIVLMKKWLAIMDTLGAKTIKLEVDKHNKEILNIHKMLGAKAIREFQPPSGKARVVLMYEVSS